MATLMTDLETLTNTPPRVRQPTVTQSTLGISLAPLARPWGALWAAAAMLLSAVTAKRAQADVLANALDGYTIAMGQNDGAMAMGGTPALGVYVMPLTAVQPTLDMNLSRVSFVVAIARSSSRTPDMIPFGVYIGSSAAWSDTPTINPNNLQSDGLVVKGFSLLGENAAGRYYRVDALPERRNNQDLLLAGGTKTLVGFTGADNGDLGMAYIIEQTANVPDNTNYRVRKTTLGSVNNFSPIPVPGGQNIYAFFATSVEGQSLSAVLPEPSSGLFALVAGFAGLALAKLSKHR